MDALQLEWRAAQSGATDDAAKALWDDGTLCAGSPTNDGRRGGKDYADLETVNSYETHELDFANKLHLMHSTA